MHDPFADDQPQPKRISTLTTLKNSQFVWVFSLVAVLLYLNIAVWQIERSSFWKDLAKDEVLEAIVEYGLTGLIGSQWPILWLLSRKYLVSFTPRVLSGWFFSHLIVVLLFMGYAETVRHASVVFSILNSCALAYVVYVIHGFMLGCLIRLFRLRGIWGEEPKSLRLSVGDLLCVTLMVAITVSEFWFSGRYGVSGVDLSSVVSISVGIGLIFLLSLLVALGIGTFLSGRPQQFVGWLILYFALVPMMVGSLVAPNASLLMYAPMYAMLGSYFLMVLLASVFLRSSTAVP